MPFHASRHTAATLMLTAGVSPRVASERLGHSTVAMTLDRYSHVTSGLRNEAAIAVEDTLRQAAASADRLSDRLSNPWNMGWSAASRLRIKADLARLVGKGRFELPTSRSRTVHSNLAELLPEAAGFYHPPL
jgi:Phage integrase family